MCITKLLICVTDVILWAPERATPVKRKKLEHTMKMRKILKSMFEQYCKTFKDVPPAGMF